MKKISRLCGYVGVFALVLFTSCYKEYSIEGGAQANYSIKGSPANCSPAVLSGFYIAGTPASAGNTLELTVCVTTAGNYTIYTLPADGLSFSASGNFADTGTTLVTLQASGIPDSAGSLSIKIPGDGGCFFTIKVLPKAPAQYTLAGHPNDCSNPVVGGTFTAITYVQPSNTITLQVLVNTPGDYHISTDTVNGISFSAAGHFIAPGTQSVVLKGYGSPKTPGLSYFNVKADSSHCSFNIPVQNSAPLASYVLQSGVGPTGNVCSPASVDGTYMAGVTLTASNTITVTPYATVGGNYTISTSKVNGMIFSASGVFTAAGPYSVALTGSGKPLASGTFIFTPFIVGPSPIGGASCDVSVTVQ
ncbi:MAG: hypothetical protein ABIY62_09740 [Ginsengibacter sp.]